MSTYLISLLVKELTYSYCSLGEEDLQEESSIALQFVKYQNVQNITVSSSESEIALSM